MSLYTFRTLKSNRNRLILTILGIALCTVMILYLFSVYKGVADGSVEYIRQNKTDFWIMQRNATNILRGTSFLTTYHGEKLERMEGIKKVSPVLLILSTIKLQEDFATVFLAGFDTEKGKGGPPEIILGRNVRKDSEIVLDKSFAQKYKFNVGDEIIIQNDTLNVVGLSSGTNAFVLQYGFVTLKQARRLIGLPSLTTVYLVDCESKSQIAAVRKELEENMNDVEVISHAKFLENNINEMESGFLPLLYSLAFIGAIVLTSILSLLLTINILERRKDYAVMKIIGSPSMFLKSLVVKQGLIISIAGCILGIIIFFPMVSLVEALSPEIDTKTTIEHIIGIFAIIVIISFVSSSISIRGLKKIYPLEVFNES